MSDFRVGQKVKVGFRTGEIVRIEGKNAYVSFGGQYASRVPLTNLQRA